MKLEYGFLIVLLLFITGLNFNKPSFKTNSIKNIIIDPGHGGKDPGTVYYDVYEKDINLKISKKLKDKLEKFQFNVYLTREDDNDLSFGNTRRKKTDFDNRIKFINSYDNALYLSIHLNYLNDENYYGPQVFYSDVNNLNKKIADYIQDYLNHFIKGNREIKKISNNIYMYQRLKIPGVLIECGFLSNNDERKRLLSEDYIEYLTDIISMSILSL